MSWRASGNTERKGASDNASSLSSRTFTTSETKASAQASAPYDHVVIFDEAQRAWTRPRRPTS